MNIVAVRLLLHFEFCCSNINNRRREVLIQMIKLDFFRKKVEKPGYLAHVYKMFEIIINVHIFLIQGQ